MSDGPEATGTPGVGSVGEEAAKLFGALQDWARTTTDPAAAGSASAPGAGLGAVAGT